MKESFKVFGKVQSIMFRQTFIRSCHRRGLVAGATNSSENRDMVTCSVEGELSEIESLKSDLISLEVLNSWGAHVTKILKLDEYIDVSAHEVTTDNVDSFKWTDGVKFFL